MVEDGLITTASAHSFAQTLARLEAAVAEKKLTIFARVDHAAGAASIGEKLRPTTLLIFGNPKGGTPLMQVRQEIGLELPLRMLVWESVSGTILVSYDDPTWQAQRLSIDPVSPAVAALSSALATLAEAAGRP